MTGPACLQALPAFVLIAGMAELADLPAAGRRDGFRGEEVKTKSPLLEGILLRTQSEILPKSYNRSHLSGVTSLYVGVNHAAEHNHLPRLHGFPRL